MNDPHPLPRLKILRRTGEESIHCDGKSLGFKVLDFWRWSASDLVSNATRGVLAEFIVANALGVSLDGVRDEWGAYDLKTPEDITVEVKSAAYVQSWAQQKLSSISFRVRPTLGWSADTNVFEKDARRQARVYVFAVLAHQDKPSVDPLNVAQWRFFVLPTSVLDARTRSQDSITLRSLETLAGPGLRYDELREAVLRAGAA